MSALTEQEFNAIVSIIQRAPMTPAEIIAMQMIVNKIKPEAAPTNAG